MAFSVVWFICNFCYWWEHCRQKGDIHILLAL